MNTSSGQTPPSEPLDDEERALAALIAREGPHGEPSPALDAKILAAAHSAVSGSTKRKPRWPVFAGAAASVLLAAGIGWQMLSDRDQAVALGEAPVREPAPVAVVEPESRHAEVAAAREAALPPPPPPEAPRPERKLRSSQPASPKPVPADDATARQEAASTAVAEPAFTPPPPAVVDVPVAAQRSKAMRAESAASPRDAAPMMQSAPAPASAPIATEAAAMADSVPLRDIPVEDDAQLSERDWLQRIEQRLAQGDRDGARDSLRRFAGKYPRTELPPELRALLDE